MIDILGKFLHVAAQKAKSAAAPGADGLACQASPLSQWSRQSEEPRLRGAPLLLSLGEALEQLSSRGRATGSLGKADLRLGPDGCTSQASPLRTTSLYLYVLICKGGTIIPDSNFLLRYSYGKNNQESSKGISDRGLDVSIAQVSHEQIMLQTVGGGGGLKAILTLSGHNKLRYNQSTTVTQKG